MGCHFIALAIDTADLTNWQVALNQDTAALRNRLIKQFLLKSQHCMENKEARKASYYLPIGPDVFKILFFNCCPTLITFLVLCHPLVYITITNSEALIAAPRQLHY